MSGVQVYKVKPAWKKRALIDDDTYLKWYAESVKNPDKFWGKHGKRIDWFKPYTKVKNTSFKGKVSIKWFEDGLTNVSHNCIDRHLKKRGNQVAIIWEGDNPYDDKKITYNELHEHVCRLANVMKKHGVKKGDRVTIYMPMIPEAAYAMLACTRIGAIHSIVFGGFSPDALAGRIVDCESTFVITADEGLRGGKTVPLKENTDKAIDLAAKQFVMVKDVLVVRRTGGKIGWAPGRDHWYHDEIATVDAKCPPEKMKAEDPLFILYTSGSTGKPKGVLHTTGGYLVFASMTHQYVFDYHDGDIYWCTADVGWVTGHSYIVYGPLANGATTLMFEGVPNYPDHLALLGGHRQTQGQHLLHRAHGAARAHAAMAIRAGEEARRARRCACSVRSASPSIPKPGSGITASSATAAARSSTPGGRPKPAASSSRRFRARPNSNPDRERSRSLASSRV
jgi:acetyl-CoA synthetase